jgi:heavy metal response regulator
LRILVVEDDRKVANFIRKGLREERYAADVSRDGVEAAHLALTNDYDLIVLDVMLPGKNGIEVCRELRGKGVVTPIIMLTAKDTLEDKVRGLDAGADDYLPKPFAFEELLARVRALLRRNQEYRTPTLKVADLELDPSQHRVTRAGREIVLTGKEYALLEYLLRNAGREVSETLIMEHVWEMDFDPQTNVVGVYIHHLRQKVDRDFDTKLIHTVRGVGYVLKESGDA